MPNNTEMVDSMTQATVDAVAQTEEIPSAEESSPKTFTADEVDAKIKARIDKQNAKHATEIDALTKRLEELELRAKEAETSRDELQRKNELRAAVDEIATEYGVPAGILRGNTIDELREHAAAIKDSIPTAPVILDSGEHKQPPSSSREIFSQFMNEHF